MRDAPSINIIGWLLEKGAVVRAFDPEASETARAVLPQDGITYCEDEYDAAKDADAVLVLTEWKQFRDDLDFERLRTAMRNPEKGAVLIDGRNLYDPEEMARLGFRYQGIGRGDGKRRGVLSNGATPADH
jgi:UDPglucose 6-dehydrogenase